jgi:hypothetical protein
MECISLIKPIMSLFSPIIFFFKEHRQNNPKLADVENCSIKIRTTGPHPDSKHKMIFFEVSLSLLISAGSKDCSIIKLILFLKGMGEVKFWTKSTPLPINILAYHTERIQIKGEIYNIFDKLYEFNEQQMIEGRLAVNFNSYIIREKLQFYFEI